MTSSEHCRLVERCTQAQALKVFYTWGEGLGFDGQPASNGGFFHRLLFMQGSQARALQHYYQYQKELVKLACACCQDSRIGLLGS